MTGKVEPVRNAVIKWIDSDEQTGDIRERILYLDARADRVIVFDLQPEEALPQARSYEAVVEALKTGTAILINLDEAYYFQPDVQYSEAQRQRREERWALIGPLVQAEEGTAIFDRRKRGKLVAGAVAETGHSKRMLYTYLRLYWRNGQTRNALLPRYDRSGINRSGPVGTAKRGRPRKYTDHSGVNVDENIRKKLQVGYQRFYASGKCRTLTDAYQKTMETLFAVGEEVKGGVTVPVLPHRGDLPTLEQFKYYCHTANKRQDVLIQREGESRVMANWRPKLGSAAQMAYGPGSWYLIDSTPADCSLVSRLNRADVLGKSQLYLVKDLFSFMICGFAVSLDEPSWATQGLAIQNCTVDKVQFCAEYGIEILPEMWPCHYLPENLLGDRGEMESRLADNLVNLLGVSVVNAPPYRPDAKGPVELDFNLIDHDLYEKLSGGGKPPTERGSKDQRGLPCLTIFELTKLSIHYILHYNQTHILRDYPRDKFMISDDVAMTPLTLWNWGLENRGRHFKTVSPDLVYKGLLPRAKAAVTQRGLLFDYLHYYSAYGEEQQWFLRASRATGVKKRPRVTVAYHPHITDFIFLVRGEEMEKCFLTARDAGYAHCTRLEVRKRKQAEAIQEQALKNAQFQSKAALNANIEAVNRSALELAEADRKAAGMGRRTTTKAMRQNMAQERELERAGALPPPEPEGEKAPPARKGRPSRPVYDYCPPPDYGQLLVGADETEQKEDDDDDNE